MCILSMKDMKLTERTHLNLSRRKARVFLKTGKNLSFSELIDELLKK